MRELLILLVLIPAVAGANDFFLARSIFGRRYRWFVAPGVIVHELSHAIFCLITGSRVRHVSLFDKNGGSVEHEKPKLPIFGQILISLGPLLIGASLLYLLSRLIGLESVSLTSINPTTENIITLLKEYGSRIDIKSYREWILMYAALSIAVTMNPSLQDVKNLSVPVAVVVGTGYAIYRYTQYRPDLSFLANQQVLVIVSTIAILLILSLIFSIIVYVLSRLIKPI